MRRFLRSARLSGRSAEVPRGTPRFSPPFVWRCRPSLAAAGWAISAVLLSAPVASAQTLTLTNAGDRTVAAGASATNTISAAGTAGGGTTYIQDTFTGANNSNLTSHTPNVGGAWANEQGTNVVKLFNDRVRTTQGFGDSRVSNATVPATANYDVSMDIIWVGNTSANKIGIQGRSSGFQLRADGYIAIYNAANNRWELAKYSGSSLITLGTYSQAYVAGQVHNLRLAMAGTAVTVYVDGIARISVTDGSITGIGRTGIYFNVGGNDTNSLMGDNYLVTTSGGGASTVSFSASGLPANTTGSFSPASCTLNCSTTLTITTQASTPPGTYPVTVSGTAASGTGSTMFNFTVTSDTTPPDVSISSPASGAVVLGMVTVSAVASDNLAVAGVQFKLDGNNVGAEDTISPYAVTWDTTATTNGTHTLTAVARDIANNATVSPAVSVTVDNPVPDTQAPTVPGGLAAAAASTTQIDVSWAASTDNVGVTGYEVFRDAVRIATVAGTAYRDSALTPNTLYGYAVRAFDAAGNHSGLSTPVAVSTLPDATPPAVAITFPSNGSTLAGTVTITATATDDVGVAGVQFRLDNVNLGTEDGTAPYSVAWNTAQAAPGQHTLTAVARDSAGHTAVASDVIVTVTTAPYILNNGGNRTVLQGSSVSNTLVASQTDPGAQTGTTYAFDRFSGANGATLISHTPDIGGGWAEEQGTSVLRLLNDRVQSTQTFGDSRVSNASAPPTADYEVTLDVIWSGATSSNKIGIQGRSSGAQNRADGYIALYNAGANRWELAKYTGYNLVTLGTSSQTYVQGQTHTLKLVMVGSAISLRVDGTPRVSVTDTSVTAVGKTGIYFYTNGTDTTSLFGDNYQVSDTGGVAPTMSFAVSGLPLHSAATVTPGSCSLDCTATLTISAQNNTPLGNYPITVTGSVGLDSIATSFNLTVAALTADVEPPTVSITSPAPGATVYRTVTIAATASDNVGIVGVQFKVDGADLGGEDISAPYSASWSTSALSGSHTLTAIARDGAGNVTISTPVVVTVDNTAAPPACQFLTATSPVNIAFCEDLSQGAAAGGRAGELDDGRWSVGRIVGNYNGTNLLAFPRTPVSPCKVGVTSVDADGDLIVCDSASGHQGQLLTALNAQNYGLLSMRPRQIFDFTGRTGTISFNVDAITRGSLSWWTSVFVTDEPIPGANNTIKVTGEIPKNGVGVSFDGNNCSDSTGGQMRISTVYTFSNYAETQVPVNNAVCIQTQRGTLNHIEIRLSQSEIEVWASDYSSDNGQTFPNFRLIGSAPINLSFSRGYVHFQQEQRAPIKYGVQPTYTNNYWSNLGFDGPVSGKETAYPVQDALRPNPGTGGGDGYYVNALNVGYGLLNGPNRTYTCCSSTGQAITVQPFAIAGVDLTNVTSARLTFSISYTLYDMFTSATIVTKYRLNGGPWKYPTPTPNYSGALNGGQWVSGDAQWAVGFSFAVAVSDLVNGTNSLEIGSDGTSNGYPAILANVELLTYK